MLDRVANRLPWVGAAPQAMPRSIAALRGAGLALAGTAVIAAAAHVAIPLPFPPVPLTLPLCLYLLEGVAGLPVFQPLGPGGAAQLLGPTGGYLLSYPLVAVTAATLFRALRFRSRYAAAMTAASFATVVLFACGAVRFGSLLHLGMRATLLAAVVPFLPGEAVKVLAAAGIATAWVRRR